MLKGIYVKLSKSIPITKYRFDAKLLVYGILLLVIGLVGRSMVHWPLTGNRLPGFIDGILLAIPSLLIFAGIIVTGVAMLIWLWVILTLIIGE
jgi:protein-S-isoprenylcysteine O-methyltransferase Ste14